MKITQNDSNTYTFKLIRLFSKVLIIFIPIQCTYNILLNTIYPWIHLYFIQGVLMEGSLLVNRGLLFLHKNGVEFIVGRPFRRFIFCDPLVETVAWGLLTFSLPRAFNAVFLLARSPRAIFGLWHTGNLNSSFLIQALPSMALRWVRARCVAYIIFSRFVVEVVDIVAALSCPSALWGENDPQGGSSVFTRARACCRSNWVVRVHFEKLFTHYVSCQWEQL